MGDVAMTVPVIKNVLQQNPNLYLTILSNSFYEPLFKEIGRCSFHPAFLQDKHKGLTGLTRLFRELKKNNKFDAIADLHNVLRSTIISSFFRMRKYKVAVIDKGRKEKEMLTRRDNKIVEPLSSTHERYAETFRRLGINVELKKDVSILKKQRYPDNLHSIFYSGKKVIGIAPFAQHKEKMYPLERTKKIAKYFIDNDVEILLFGGGQYEEEELLKWEKEMPSACVIAGRFSLAEELAIISNLDFRTNNLNL